MIRLDKWLWAARFFKTRNLAKAAVEGGKVHADGVRAKPSKMVSVGLTLSIRQGDSEKTVIVKALSEQRKGAAEAALLYEETTESIQKREHLAAMHKLASAHALDSPTRPNKKQRRELLRFKHIGFKE
jgi:ribosome-associated heat shock protein Hsp15